jgi:hypothetical protein
VRAHRRQREQVVEAEHAERGGPLEQRVQHFGRRGRVGVGAMHRLDRGAEVARERVQPKVRNLVAHESTRERNGVDAAIGQPRVSVREQRNVEEAAVEADVVADDHRVTRELEKRRQHLVDARCGEHHGLRDAGEHRDHCRDRHAGVHQRLEGAEQLATP